MTPNEINIEIESSQEKPASTEIACAGSDPNYSENRNNDRANQHRLN